MFTQSERQLVFLKKKLFMTATICLNEVEVNCLKPAMMVFKQMQETRTLTPAVLGKGVAIVTQLAAVAALALGVV